MTTTKQPISSPEILMVMLFVSEVSQLFYGGASLKKIANSIPGRPFSERFLEECVREHNFLENTDK